MDLNDNFKNTLATYGFRGVWCNSVHPSDNFGACMSFRLFGDGWRTFASAMGLDTTAVALAYADMLDNPHAKQRVLGFAANNWTVTVMYWRTPNKERPYVTDLSVEVRIPRWLIKMADNQLALDAAKEAVGSHEWLTLAEKVANQIKDLLDEELKHAGKNV